MELRIGQKVTYPSQGVCLVEHLESKTIGGTVLQFYALRVLSDNSIIFVPMCNANSVGLRPIISSSQCRLLIKRLSTDFEPVSGDWKTRSREFSEKLQSGDVFQAADVLKKLAYLSHEKKLSFREQTLMEKAKFLIVSEITNAEKSNEAKLRAEIDRLVEITYKQHCALHPELAVAAAAAH
ncbi:MAG: CarD family transcriptional regulator [Pyrinomonadaceae bacterium]